MITFTSFILISVYIWKGDLDQAIQYGELSVKKAFTPLERALAQSYLAWALCRAGEIRKGAELHSGLLKTYPVNRYVPFLTIHLCQTGEGYFLAGDYDRASKTLEEALELADKCGMRFYQGWIHRLLGEITLKTNPAKSSAHFEKSIAVLREINAENELALTYSGYGRFHKQQGNIKQAREYLMKSLEIFERLGTLLEPDKVRKELAELPKE
jgi:tetratricopeptide (TPR) repeat protein